LRPPPCRSCRRLRSLLLKKIKRSQPSAAPTFLRMRRTRAGGSPQGALEKQYRLSLLQVFAMRQ
jgi:hypothetical protein